MFREKAQPKILIVKLGSIGDVIHTLPTLSAIRQSLPEAHISWVVEKKAAEILRENPILDDLIEVDTKSLRKTDNFISNLKNARNQFKRLRSVKFDVALDFQGLLKSAFIAKLSGAKRIYGFEREQLREPASRFLYDEAVKIEPLQNVIEKNLALAKDALQIKVPTLAENYVFPIAANENHRLEAENLHRKVNGKFVILNPGGGWVTKLWDARKFGRLADEIWRNFGFKTIVNCAPNEENLASTVIDNCQTGQIFAASLSLKGFSELLKRAELYVGGDTSVTHLAVAAKTPVVGIFGPTEWWRNGSPIETDICVERDDIGCRVDCHR
ncbi:MAG: lipopolysaccharide heptosyltransferase I, partial [Pyrinomonadaceae bacterium]|nr:lipopolysaccharide heptosyltransferase I [Pyrinomonadaceae bacterium]